jgi:mRNA interferase RelE/StbE
MTYNLDFNARALKEWRKLGDTIRQPLKKKRFLLPVSA